MIQQNIQTHSSSNRYIKPILTPTLIINYMTIQYFLYLEMLIFKNKAPPAKIKKTEK